MDLAFLRLAPLRRLRFLLGQNELDKNGFFNLFKKAELAETLLQLFDRENLVLAINANDFGHESFDNLISIFSAHISSKHRTYWKIKETEFFNLWQSHVLLDALFNTFAMDGKITPVNLTRFLIVFLSPG